MTNESETPPNNFIQQRLDSLNSIDGNIVALLDNISSLFETYSTPKNSNTDYQEVKSKFTDQTRSVYNALSKVAIDLRKEVKIMDDNIGVYDKNDEKIMILPLSVDQKNTTLGALKLKDELRELDRTVGRNSRQQADDVEMADSSAEVKLEAAGIKSENSEQSAVKAEHDGASDAMEDDFER